MKLTKQKKLFLCLGVSFLVLSGLIFASGALALTESEVGLNQVAQSTILPTTDIRILVANIIRYALGVLGIIAVGIILYGGFVWMTSGGNEEKVAEAKKIMINGAIGLAIILLAFAIVSFIFKVLTEASNGPERCGTVGDTRSCYYCCDQCLAHQTCQATPNGNFWGSCAPDDWSDPPCNCNYYDNLRVAGFSPKNEAVPIRNIVARTFFNLDVDPATLKDKNGNNLIRVANLGLRFKNNPLDLSTCGNATLESGEECDPADNKEPNYSNNDGCTNNCLFTGSVDGQSVCGDSTIGLGENCDDGNLVDGDGCSSKCLKEGKGGAGVCGNGQVTDFEECDLGDKPAADWENSNCDPNTCLNTGSSNYAAIDDLKELLDAKLAAGTLAGMITAAETTSGTLEAKGLRVNFTPSLACPPPNADLKCFEKNTAYGVEVLSGIKSSGGKALTCTPSNPCYTYFISGEKIDTQAPTINITSPQRGQGVPFEEVNYGLLGQAKDDGGVSYIEYSVYNGQGNLVPIKYDFGGGLTFDVYTDFEPEGAPLPDSYLSHGYWDIFNFQLLEKPKIKAVAYDFDAHESPASEVQVIVRPQHCFDGVQNEDETGVDCGGPYCGACDGEDCNFNDQKAQPYVCSPNDFACASGYCDPGNCKCRHLPVITGIDLTDGAVGNLVTITGKYFGTKTGPAAVTFTSATGGVQALYPADVNSACGDTWQDDQIIVIVPTGAITGPIKVVDQYGNFDTTAPEIIRYPGSDFIGNFTVNTTKRPGVCKLDPAQGKFGDNIKVIGLSFGDGSGETDKVTFGGVVGPVIGGTWTDKSIMAQVPNIAQGFVGVKVMVKNQESNGVKFVIATGGFTTDPVIEYLSPKEGGVGQYVTIFGRNFGSKKGTVKFLDVNGKEAWGDDSFPAECDQTWSDEQIIIKVPLKFKDGSSVVPGAYSVTIVRQSDNKESNSAAFDVKNVSPTPGVCKLSPDNGPVATTTYAIGEKFGQPDPNQTPPDHPVNKITFWSINLDPKPRGIVSSWDDRIIKALVPQGADSGPTRVFNKEGIGGNEYKFTVGFCSQNSCNGHPDDIKCDSSTKDTYAGLDQCWRCDGKEWQWDFNKMVGGSKVCTLQPRDCCETGVCLTKSPTNPNPCQSSGPKANFTWAYSTGDIPLFPTVIEECNRDQTCPDGVNPPSPSPWTPKWDEEKGWEYACVNSLITARFSLSMYKPSLIYKADGSHYSNIIVEKCADGSCAAAGRTYVDGVITIGTSEQENDYFEFKPTSNLATNTYYQVVIKGESKDGDDNNEVRAAKTGGLPGYAMQFDYVWKFKTRTSAEPCKIGCPDVIPDPYTAREKGLLKDSAGDPLYHRAESDAEDNPCIFINVDQYNWLWASSKIDRATISQNKACSLKSTKACSVDIDCLSGEGKCFGLPFQQATAIKETAVNDPALINAKESESGKNDDARLHVDFADPEVIARWPDCDTACVNTQIGVAFNMEMYLDFVPVEPPTRAKIYSCGNDSGCVNDLLLLNKRDFHYVDYEGEVEPPFYNHELTFQISASYPGYPQLKDKLLPNNYYRVVIISASVMNHSGVPLSKLNYDDNSDGKLDSYSWVFKTKNDTNLCAIDHINVLPRLAKLYQIPDYSLFGGQAMGTPDQCTPFGQRLDNYAYAWKWSETDIYFPQPPGFVPVAEIFNRSGCGNGVIERGEDCDDGNIDSHDGCFGATSSTPCTWEGTLSCVVTGDQPPCCGNGVLETGEECDLGSVAPSEWAANYCKTTSCLHLGNENHGYSVCGNGVVEAGEDCDNGTEPNDDDTDGCTNQCLASGSVAGQSICGDGQIGFGEECETCWAQGDNYTINSGSCAASDLALGNPVVSGDGCSSKCLNEGSPNNYGDVCGNSIVEPGEECEFHGGVWDYKCNHTTCLNLGNIDYGISVCGNGILDLGEDCDNGDEPNDDNSDGCANNCLHSGSAVGGAYPGPFQLAESKNEGQAGIIAKAGGSCADGSGPCSEPYHCPGSTCDLSTQKEGAGELDVICGQTSCQPGYGLDTRGCCRLRPQVEDPQQPAAGANGVCRNTLIYADFDKLMNPVSFNNNVIIKYTKAGNPDCPLAKAEGTKSFWAKVFGRDGFLARAYQRVVGYVKKIFVPEAQAADVPVEKCVVESYTSAVDLLDFEGKPLKTRALVRLHEMLPADAHITITIKAGVKDIYGVNMDSDFSWSFDTSTDVCLLQSVDLVPETASLEKVGQSYQTMATAKTSGLQPIQPVYGIYSWAWGWNLNDIGIKIAYLGSTDLPPPYQLSKYCTLSPNSCDSCVAGQPCAICNNGPDDKCVVSEIQRVTAKDKNGEGVLTATATIVEDEIGGTAGLGYSDNAALVVFICENPWPRICYDGGSIFTDPIPASDPPRACQTNANCDEGDFCAFSAYLFEDAEGTVIPGLLPYYTNFKTYYCRDAGNAADMSDDLPALAVANDFSFLPVVIDLDLPFGGSNLLRHILLTRAVPAAFWGGESGSSNDAIIISVERNIDHLSPQLWFQEKFNGTGAATKVDGYEAISLGNAYYINAGNWIESYPPKYLDGVLFTNMYILSQTENSNATTQNIFQQLVQNLRFNTNVISSNVCHRDGNVMHNLNTGLPVSCSKDFDCYRCTSDVSIIDPDSDVICETNSDCTSACAQTNPDGSCAKAAPYCANGKPAGPVPGYALFCDSPKDKIIRNVKRAADIHDIRDLLNDFHAKNGIYPELKSGSYIEFRSFSAWPSWQATLANQLGSTLPVDPINQFNGCSAPYNPSTCWDNQLLRFECPQDSYTYFYRSQDNGQVGEVIANMENFNQTLPMSLWEIATASEKEYEDEMAQICYNFEGYVIGDLDNDGVKDSIDNCILKPNGYFKLCSEPGADPNKCCPFNKKEQCCSWYDPDVIPGTPEYTTMMGNINTYCNQNNSDNPTGDSSKDKLGDACDVCPADPYHNDTDGDGLCGPDDNCWGVVNPQQTDSDLDCHPPFGATDPACGDACDQDTQSGCWGSDPDDCPAKKNTLCVGNCGGAGVTCHWNGFGGQANCCGDDPGENPDYDCIPGLYCGNGKIDPKVSGPAEQCDDGNDNNNDVCNNQCQWNCPPLSKGSNSHVTFGDNKQDSIILTPVGGTLNTTVQLPICRRAGKLFVDVYEQLAAGFKEAGVVFVSDKSGSMGSGPGSKRQLLEDAIVSAIDTFQQDNPDIEVALVNFDNTVDIYNFETNDFTLGTPAQRFAKVNAYNLSSWRTKIHYSLNTSGGGGTRHDLALNEARWLLDDTVYDKRIVVFMTDGATGDSYYIPSLSAAGALKGVPADVFTVTVNTDQKLIGYMNGISSSGCHCTDDPSIAGNNDCNGASGSYGDGVVQCRDNGNKYEECDSVAGCQSSNAKWQDSTKNRAYYTTDGSGLEAMYQTIAQAISSGTTDISFGGGTPVGFTFEFDSEKGGYFGTAEITLNNNICVTQVPEVEDGFTSYPLVLNVGGRTNPITLSNAINNFCAWTNNFYGKE